METLSRRKFRKKHNCKSCLYYSKTKRCIAEQICPLEFNTIVEQKKRTCPLDETGTCPYGNQLGTCFGFCLKKILSENKSSEEVQSQ